MFVEIITAIGSLVTTGLGLLVFESKPTKKINSSTRPISIDSLKNAKEFLLTHPFKPEMSWLDSVTNYLNGIGKPMTPEDYKMCKSVIYCINWIKNNPPYASPQWFYSYRKFVIDNDLNSVVIGVQQVELTKWCKRFAIAIVGVILPIVAPALIVALNNVAQKYSEGTLKASDLEQF